VLGSVVSVVWALVSLGRLVLPTASRNVSTPLGPRMAIQYLLPALSGLAGRATVFQLPAFGEDSLPCASKVPGWPFLSV
jgi:hypothetical protein